MSLERWSPHLGPQLGFLTSSCFEILYGGAAGGGKALSLSTPIPTPEGWTTMGELRQGDLVFNQQGVPVSVLACSDVMTGRPCIEVETGDGERIVADADHLWRTTTVSERSSAAKRTDEFRKARRAKRPKRGKGKRPDLAARNAASGAGSPAALPTQKTTAQIAETLDHQGRTNHAIDAQGPLYLPDAELPIGPYALGLWLGDGTSANGDIAIAEAAAVDVMRITSGYSIRRRKKTIVYKVEGLRPQLKAAGLLKNKHIPPLYQRASFGQRLALLQGLCDSDGHAKPNGAIEFTTTSPALRDGMLELLAGLGIKVRAREGRSMLYAKDCGPKWRLVFLTRHAAFRIPRKLGAQKRSGFRGTHRRRWIVAARPVASVPVRCIKVEGNGMFLCGRSMLPTHNSDALLAGAARYIHRRKYRAVLARRTVPELEGSDGLIERSRDMYEPLGAHYQISKKRWLFPSGARISFITCENEALVRGFGGWQFQYLGVDELTTFTKAIYEFLVSRLRTTTDIPCLVRATSNPGGPGHDWVLERFRWWLYREGERIDEFEGPYLDPSGLAFVRRDPDSGKDGLCDAGDKGATHRMFIPALLADNPSLAATDYGDRLNMLDVLSRRQLVDGDWMARAEPGMFWDRAWCKHIDRAPDMPVSRVRYWDLAGTDDESGKKDPAWTAGVLMSILRDDTIVVEDVARCRRDPGGVEAFFEETADADAKAYGNIDQVIEQDPGQAGKFEVSVLAGNHPERDIRGWRPTGDKVTRFKPFSAAACPRDDADHGKVAIVKGRWNLAYHDELEAFPPRSRKTKADQADASSGAFEQLKRGDHMGAIVGSKRREMGSAASGF